MYTDRRGLDVLLLMLALGVLGVLLYYLTRLFGGLGTMLPA